MYQIMSSPLEAVKELSVAELREEMTARFKAHHNLTEIRMRSIVTKIVEGAWENNERARALPALQSVSAMYESLLVLQKYGELMQNLIEGVITHAPVDKARWTLLLIRLARLREWPPIPQHMEAFTRLSALILRRFGIEFPQERGPITSANQAISWEVLGSSPQKQLNRKMVHDSDQVEIGKTGSEEVLDIMVDEDTERQLYTVATITTAPSKRTLARRQSRKKARAFLNAASGKKRVQPTHKGGQKCDRKNNSCGTDAQRK